MLSPSSILQSDQSSSRAPSESPPSQSGPAFLLPLAAIQKTLFLGPMDRDPVKTYSILTML
jgi:hypothetical protein